MKMILVAGLGGMIGGTLAAALVYGETTDTRLGMVTYSPKFRKLGLPLDAFDDLLIAGWDLHRLDLSETVKRHPCVPDGVYAQIEKPLGRIPVRAGLIPGETDIQRWFHTEATWLDGLKREQNINSMVLVNLCPTAPASPEAPADWADVRDLDWKTPGVTVSRLYFRFAVEVGAHFINFTPNWCEIDPLAALACARGLLYAGRDGKTGQTFLKTLIAPAFRDKNFRIDGWFSTNILGNEDGRTLSDPSNAPTKIASKHKCLQDILGYVPGDNEYNHQVTIHYYPPRGDAKEAWDNIDFSGMFGHGMQLKLNWLGMDSILAAPAVLDLVRLTFLAERTGQTGAMDALGYFFKSPLAPLGGSPLHDVDLQFAALVNWAIDCKAHLENHGTAAGRDDAGWPKWPEPDPEAMRQIQRVFDRGTWAISGETRSTSTLEQEICRDFAAFVGMPYAVACASGSSGLMIALEAAGIGFGDRVLVPPAPWVACASAVMAIGAIPVFCDLEPDGLCMSAVHAESLLDSGIKAVLLVHALCAIADIPAFEGLCRARGIPIIEDCSQAHGAEWAGRKAGSFGTMSVFSMQQTKVLTSGEGGLVLCRTEDHYEKLQQLRADGRGWSHDPWAHGHHLEERGQVQGYNYCLSEIQSGLLLAGLAQLPAQNQHRAENALRLTELLRDCPVHVHFRYTETYKPALYEYAVSLPAVPDGHAAALAHQASREIKAPVFAFDPPIYRHRLYRPQTCRRFPADHIEKLVRECAVHLPEVERRAASTLCFPHRLFLGDASSMVRLREALVRVMP